MLLCQAAAARPEGPAIVPSLTVGYVWHAGVHAAQVASGLERIGFEIVSQVIWDKGLFAIGRSWYHWGHEPCWVVRKVDSKARFLGERNQSTIWRAPSPKMIMGGSDEPKVDHPTQKPVALYEAPIGNHLRRGEPVYDPFLGSGTTLVAAERLGRRCYAMEIDPRYVQVTIERWQTFTRQTAVKIDAKIAHLGRQRGPAKPCRAGLPADLPTPLSVRCQLVDVSAQCRGLAPFLASTAYRARQRGNARIRVPPIVGRFGPWPARS